MESKYSPHSSFSISPAVLSPSQSPLSSLSSSPLDYSPLKQENTSYPLSPSPSPPSAQVSSLVVSSRPTRTIRVGCSKAQKYGDGYLVELSIPREIFESILDILRTRQGMEEFIKKHQNYPKLLLILQRLTYLVEYCRMKKLPKIYLVQANYSQAENAILDLMELIFFNKKCNQCTQGREATIFCQECLVGCWCSNDCKKKGAEAHRTICQTACFHRKQLGL
eukprot:TRINITY_DN6207_c0_g1_i1.p1 TRINITY_DN6207_c0_g1~~TRINITY_DN6207_c0_g1_i1.p1  ORF type:complete len:236 (+),score=43.85 TRINITY_DN6207_c0_g1_i1:44-709(+)